MTTEYSKTMLNRFLIFFRSNADYFFLFFFSLAFLIIFFHQSFFDFFYLDDAEWLLGESGGKPLRLIPRAIILFERLIFGLRPFLFKMVNFIFHSINAVLIFAFIRLTIGSKNSGLYGGLFFIFSTLLIPSFIWTVSLEILLSAGFLLLSLILIHLSITKRKQNFSFFSITSLIFAIFCKEEAIIYIWIYALFILFFSSREFLSEIWTFIKYLFVLPLLALFIIFEMNKFQIFSILFSQKFLLYALKLTPSMWYYLFRNIVSEDYRSFQLNQFDFRQIIHYSFFTLVPFLFITLLLAIRWVKKRPLPAKLLLFYISLIWIIIYPIPFSYYPQCQDPFSARHLYFPIVGSSILIGIIFGELICVKSKYKKLFLNGLVSIFLVFYALRTLPKAYLLEHHISEGALFFEKALNNLNKLMPQIFIPASENIFNFNAKQKNTLHRIVIFPLTKEGELNPYARLSSYIRLYYRIRTEIHIIPYKFFNLDEEQLREFLQQKQYKKIFASLRSDDLLMVDIYKGNLRLLNDKEVEKISQFLAK